MNKMVNENITIIEDSKSKKAYIQYYIWDEKKQKQVRKKKSTGLPYNPKNVKYIKDRVIPKLMIQKNQGKGLLFQNRVDIEKISVLTEELFKELRAERTRREYTIKDYSSYMTNHFLPVFGEKMIGELTADNIHNFFIGLKVKEKTKSNIRVPISLLLKKAFRMNLISINPLNGVEKNLLKGNKKKDTNSLNNVEDKKKMIEINQSIDPFSEQEIKLILETAQGKFKNYLGILFFTGMRPSELIYLEWKNVNFEERYLIVEGAITGEQTKAEETETKTQASRRVVYLSKKALHYLQAQYELTKGNKFDKVFLSQRKVPYTSPDSFRENDWKKLFDKGRKQIEKGVERKTIQKKYNMGIRYRDLYNLRHSFASINLSLNRLPLLLVSKQLGHSTSEVTLKKYATYKVDDDDATLDLLDNSVSNYL